MKVLVCDGCRKPASGELAVLSFRDFELDYCEPCREVAAAFLEAANVELARILGLWKDELVRLKGVHAPLLKRLPIPAGVPED